MEVCNHKMIAPMHHFIKSLLDHMNKYFFLQSKKNLLVSTVNLLVSKYIIELEYQSTN